MEKVGFVGVGAAWPAESASGREIVISILPTGKEVGEAVFGPDGIAEAEPVGRIAVSTWRRCVPSPRRAAPYD